jgi:hypothetical protein
MFSSKSSMDFSESQTCFRLLVVFREDPAADDDAPGCFFSFGMWACCVNLGFFFCWAKSFRLCLGDEDINIAVRKATDDGISSIINTRFSMLLMDINSRLEEAMVLFWDEIDGSLLDKKYVINGIKACTVGKIC